jgi:hypothetical protein
MVAELLISLEIVKSDPAARGAADACGARCGRAQVDTTRTTAARARALIRTVVLVVPGIDAPRLDSQVWPHALNLIGRS